MIIRFSGINNPEEAEALKGAEIIVEREKACPLKESEYYVEDLKGLEVTTTEGKVLGHINDIIEGGNGDLTEVKLLSGELAFAPFRNEFFGPVDLEHGKIILLEPWILEP